MRKPPQLHNLRRLYQKGQTLVEFAFVCMVVFVILAGAFYVGNAMLQGQYASDAIKEPAMPTNKLEMADNPAAIGAGQVKGYVDQHEGTATLVDNINFVQAGNEVSLIIGEKTTNTAFMGMPAFTFTVTQGLQKNLLAAANAGGAKVTPRNGWLPNGVTEAPWQKFDRSNLPEFGAEWFGDCSDRTPVGGEAVLRSLLAFIGADDTDPAYLSRTPSAYASPFKVVSFIKIAEKFADECNANRPQYQATCEQTASELVYREEVTYYPENPNDLLDICYPGGACYEMDGGAECALTGNKVEVKKIKNPPGASGIQINVVKWPCQGPLASAETLEEWNNAGSGIIRGVHDSHGVPQGLNQPLPADFVRDCVDRKVAECMFDRGDNMAEQLRDAYNENTGECVVAPKS